MPKQSDWRLLASEVIELLHGIREIPAPQKAQWVPEGEKKIGVLE
jgi:hypothetical protein